MSQDLQWLLLRNYNSFIVKRPNTGSKAFSREKGNLLNKHSFKYSGLANDKTIDVSLTKNKGISISTRKDKATANQVKAGRNRQIIKGGNSGSRKVAGQASKAAAYRGDLRSVALARANRLRASRNPKPIKEKPSRKNRKAAAAASEE